MDLLEKLEEHSKRHPWELSRADSMLGMILPALDGNRNVIADVGCGDLFFADALSSRINGMIYAIDTGFAEEDLGNSSPESGKAILLNDVARLQDASVDILILMDVLEHIEHPVGYLKQLCNKMSKNGAMFITVPAYQHLFSEHDVYLKHFRRYNKKSLCAELACAGFIVQRIFYFYSMLYPLRLLQLIISKTTSKSKMNMVKNASVWKHPESSIITKLMRWFLNLDFAINKMLNKGSFFGLSLCAVCRLPEE